MRSLRNRRWSAEEKKYLLENYPYKSLKEIAVHLGRSYVAVQHKTRHLRPINPPPSSINDELDPCECSYLGACLDGEGTLRITKQLMRPYKRFNYAARMTFYNNSRNFLEKIKGILNNGSLRPRKRYRSCHATAFYLKICSPEKLEQVLPQIKGWLVIKKPQAEVMLEFLELKRQWRWNKDPKIIEQQAELYQKMKELNKR